MAPVMALAMAPVMAGEMTYHSTPLHSTQIRVLDALVKVRSTLAESDTSTSPIVKAVAREASTGGWRC